MSFRYIPRTFQLLLSTVLFYPFFIIEKIIFTKRINKTKLTQDPIFILGHWRSGTTYLHNLISQDKHFAFPTTYQCFMPGTFLTGKSFLRFLLKILMPSKRPMDNVKLAPDYPQEEEFAINVLCPYSYYVSLCFPKKAQLFFNKFALLETDHLEEWKRQYTFFLKKISFINNNKQILSKNPVNTARISALLELYPNAKFIYIKRDKEQVLNSTFNLYQKFIDLYSLQKFSKDEILSNLNWLYDKTLQSYETQKILISPGNLVEIDYQNLLGNPFNVIEKIYKELNFNTLESAKSDLANYIESQKSYQPNTEVFLSSAK